jgi:hypothetical protein
MQIKTPKFQLAQRGCLLRLQSAQILLPSSFNNALMVCWFCAARSAGAAPRRDIFGDLFGWIKSERGLVQLQLAGALDGEGVIR